MTSTDRLSGGGCGVNISDRHLTELKVLGAGICREEKTFCDEILPQNWIKNSLKGYHRQCFFLLLQLIVYFNDIFYSIKVVNPQNHCLGVRTWEETYTAEYGAISVPVFLCHRSYCYNVCDKSFIAHFKR